ncbi:MAG: hypothetical protein KJ944_08570 [Alphaproteobacteria bacterium]|nr:hypothetical protein [Alphaproteobacteria bacterium]MBU1561531.1 hypothetical protein [Alphaproteobacteria bacterium]MBU2302636.1 hypothetical protein [Alphaproteobacteria bacterium]MBU2367710.1 hypothetical protein [Alphaproteobacteria bacterium]
MISDSEFIAIRAFDRTLFNSVDSAQRIINEKNGQLIALARQLQAAQRELEIERGKRKLAEYKLLRRQ